MLKGIQIGYNINIGINIPSQGGKSMCQLKFSDVFKPGSYPEHTYITRYSTGTRYTYEQRLNQCLDIEGFLTLIVGSSKTGKTVLCDKVIGSNNIVSLTGNDFRNSNDFWSVVAKKIDLPMSGEFIESSSTTSSSQGELTTIKQHYLGSKDKVINFFKQNNKTLILDDFHYAPKEIQFDIACQLKDVIRFGFRAVIISLPHRSDDAIRLNPDLVGRVSLIEIAPWTKEELKQIAIVGFNQLAVNITDQLSNRIAMESINSPQLMQAICLNLSYVIDPSVNDITSDNIEASCEFTCINFPYLSVVKMLKDGPPSRGQQRIKYKLTNGEDLDIYSLILKVLALNPPHTSLEFDEIKSRIEKILITSNVKFDNKKIKDALKNIQKLLEVQENFYQVFEWKDNCIYILDPLFLFYLRWQNVDSILTNY